MSLLMSQHPRVQEVAETRKAKRDIAAYEKMSEFGRDIELETEDAFKNDPNTSVELKKEKAESIAQAQSTIAQKGAEGYRRMFEINPTERNYEIYEREAGGVANVAREKERYFSKLDKQREAAAKAKDSGTAEAERIALHNRIMEGVYSTDPAFDIREKYKKKEVGK